MIVTLLNSVVLINVIICLTIGYLYYKGSTRLRRWIVAFLIGYVLTIGFILGGLGWNTVDWMMNTFAWSDAIEPGYQWWMNTEFYWDWWNCFFYLGIAPFGIGCALFGGLMTFIGLLITKMVKIE